MPQSLAKVAVHIVFSTKSHRPTITNEIRNELFAYMGGILRNLESSSIAIGGTDNHVHILCTMSRNLSIAKLVEKVKVGSSKWIKTNSNEYADFQWQSGYGIFSVSHSAIPAVTDYINSQQEHHQKLSFADEFRMFLEKYQIGYDERYVWD